MLRLFETGHREEPRMVANLRAAGCEVHDRDEAGEQFGISAIAGHFKGHADGVALGIHEAPKTWHLLEFKTHSAKSYKALESKGVKESKPQHYAQMQVYMRHMGIDRAFYLAQNKDTDELYAERINHDELASAQIMQRAASIIGTNEAPERINSDPDSWDCRYCHFKTLCHGHEPSAPAVPATVHCRNCIHSTPEMDGDGRWSCAKHGSTLTPADQIKTCPHHLFLPTLLTFATPVDGGEVDGVTWIEYQREDGHKFRMSKHANDYTSAELTNLPAALVGLGTVDEVKTIFGAVAEQGRGYQDEFECSPL